MKRLFTTFAALLLSTALLAGCAEDKTIDGVTYQKYGLFSLDRVNPDIAYDLSVGNLFWGIMLVETIVAPIYFFGFAIMEPVGKKPPVKGQVPQP